MVMQSVASFAQSFSMNSVSLGKMGLVEIAEGMFWSGLTAVLFRVIQNHIIE